MAIYTGYGKQLGGTEKVTLKQQVYYGLVQKNVLITGANGQLGSELKHLTQTVNTPFRYLFTDADQLDITDLQQVRDFVAHHAIKFIINCAAYTAVDNAEKDAETCIRINHHGAENIAKAAKEFDCKMIHISTDYVFDGKTDIPYNETDATHPLSVYGKSKSDGEEAVQKYSSDAVIIRTQWLYSSYGKNFVKTMLRLLAEKNAINVVNDQYGAPTYAADLAEGILEILLDAEKAEWKPGIYHFANTGTATWYALTKKIQSLSGLNDCMVNSISSKAYPTLAERPMYSVLDTTKIQNTFRFSIPEWEDALKRCLDKLDALHR